MIQIRRDPQGAAGGGGPRFSPGAIVYHKRYRYRGVVVEADPACRADEGWWQNNATQPSREQAWYHVLPHGMDHVKYVADENLMPDPTGEAVAHPWIPVYFSAYEGGRYRRNDKPWGSA